MLARASFRAATAPSVVARRGFQSTRTRLASPFHYPEGPRSNLPFDPLKRGFAFKYWGFMGMPVDAVAIAVVSWLTAAATGFAIPFLLAGSCSLLPLLLLLPRLTAVVIQSGKPRRTNDPERPWHIDGRVRKQRPCRVCPSAVNNRTRHHSINFISLIHASLSASSCLVKSSRLMQPPTATSAAAIFAPRFLDKNSDSFRLLC